MHMHGRNNRLSTKHRDVIVVFALLCLASTLFFFRLGATGLFDADEPAYAEAAREMLVRADWVTPTFNGQLRPDKPILFYWLLITSYRVFGMTPFAVRCWSALAGVGLTLLVCAAARRWLGRPADLWVPLVFVTAPLTALLGRAGVTDMVLTFWMCCSMFAGLSTLDERSVASRRWAAAAWAAAAVASLTKGPVGLLVPAMALGGGLLIRGEFRQGVQRLFRWEGLAAFATIAGPWYALILARSGWDFVQGFVFKHNIGRFTGVVSGHSGPVWFYVPVLLIGFFPWIGYLPVAFRSAGTFLKRGEGSAPQQRLLATCLAWFVSVFVFFSLAATKLPSYLFLAFPALALLAGRTIAMTEEGGGDDKSPRWATRLGNGLLLGIGLPLAAGLCLLPFVFDRIRPLTRGVLDGVPPPTGIAWAIGLLVFIGTVTGATCLRWRGQILAAMMIIFILTAAMIAPQAYAIVQAPLRTYAETAARLLGPDDPVIMYGLNAPSVVFYAARRVVSFGPDDRAELADAIARMRDAQRPVVVITRAQHVRRIEDLPGLALRDAHGGYALFTAD